MGNQHQPFVIERSYNAPVERIWKAITDKDDMKQWYFDLREFKPIVGFSFEFYGKGSTGQTMKHLCQVTEVQPLKKLVYSWKYEGYQGISYVTFELFPEGNGTKLKLTHAGLETFPPLADFAKDNFVKGWTELIGSLLKTFVEQ
jgi:uncharacterized protein YndB with AHSA1/START domain